MPTIPYKLKNGKRIKGVTTICKNVGWGNFSLCYWYNQRGLEGKSVEDLKKEIPTPGTVAHLLVESHLKNIAPDLSPFSKEFISKGETGFINFLTWAEKHHLEPLHVEPHLISEINEYGGTPDLIASLDGKPSLVDWKSGKIYESTFLQLVGYDWLIQENYNFTLDGGFHLVRIPTLHDTPTFHHNFWHQLPKEAEEAFGYALRLSKIEPILKTYL